MALTPALLQRELTPTPTGSEAGREFNQSRVSLYFSVISGISLVFFLLHNTLEVLSNNLTFAQVFSFPLNHWHLGAVALAGLLGFATRRGEWSPTALAWIDVTGSVAVLACDDMMGSVLLGVNAPHFDLVLTLAYVLLQMTRAVIVPSTVRRTILVCILGAVPLMLMGWLLARYAPDGWSAKRTMYAPLYVALWCLDAAIPAALASSVIYGLRQQVRRASQLGQYTLEERIGEGGMGTVYRARHAMLRRPTAVKLLRPERTGEQALIRFEREVQLTSRLTHPNTVSIYDYGRTADGVFYYAMEYLDGLDLQRLVDVDGPQDPARVVHLLAQVCRALNEAHGLGLIHRDVKPANIILCEHGGVADVVKVVDFGLVKTFGGTDATLSGSDVIVGTPHFLAPEAIRSGSSVDIRSDLYAVGAVGYFLIAGRYVFDGDSALEVCGHHLHTQPAPLSTRTTRRVPSELEDLILRCLAKNPEQRPQTALALLQQLLACGTPAWTDEQARAWWAQRREAGLTKAAQPLSRTPTLLEVDVRARGLEVKAGS
jgi:serine/threonine-protein kinase